MENNWRTIQLFMARDLDNKNALEVSEVSIHEDENSSIKCTCKNYLKHKLCKHVTYVRSKIEKNDGSFGLLIPENIPDEVAFLAFNDADSSRNFILNYGKIEVM